MMRENGSLFPNFRGLLLSYVQKSALMNLCSSGFSCSAVVLMLRQDVGNIMGAEVTGLCPPHLSLFPLLFD